MKPTYKKDIYSDSPFFKYGSRLVYGTSGLGGVWGEVNEEESIECLIYAFENDIKSVDTSPSYNRSEEFVGKALKRWNGDMPFISTKVGRLPAEKADECYVDYSEKSMRQSLMRSLDKLNLHQVDLLFLHEPHLVPLSDIEQILDTLRLFVGEGLTRMVGIGGNPTDEFRKYVLKDNFDVVSGFLKVDGCNLTGFDRDIPKINTEGIAYYAASSLHMSLLGNRFEKYVRERPDNEWITNQDVDNAIKIKKIADREDMKISTLAQRFLFSINEADRIVMGARNIGQIQSTIEDWRMGALPEELFNEITETIR
ncbi:aldo/keto reductase [Bacteroidota bacterium]